MAAISSGAAPGKKSAASGSRGLLFAGAEVQQGAGLLLQAVEYADPDLQMPPAGRLPAEEIAK
ncbi:MAG: hypothetical protein ACKON9_03685, partial [Planctomycetaceae bacterium]